MSKMKAVVLEKSGTRYTVLGKNGTFSQVHRRLNAEVGEEIEIQTGIDIFDGLRVWAGVAALFILVLTALLGWNLYQAPTAVALLSIDINPSLQFAIDAEGHLLKLQSQNDDAKRMLSQIDLKGKSVEEVLAQIVNQAYDQKFLSSEQHWVVVGYSPMADKTLDQMPKELNENQIISWITEIGERKGMTPQVAVFFLTSQERELAQKGDLTLGEYALWQTADKAGVVMQQEKLKETSERVRLLEDPQVQVQIKVEKNKRTQDSGSIGKLGEDRTGKLLPGGKLFSPIKVLDPWIDESRSNDGHKDQQKDEDKNNSTQKDKDNAKDENKQKVKDQEKDQTVDQESENKDSQRTKYGRIYVSPIPTQENLKRDTSRTYKFPEFNRDKQGRR